MDLFSTSKEGLDDLLAATRIGQVFVYHNHGGYTFHPKVYLFTSPQRADVLVGSGNLTCGGLFTNYEASLAASLDLAVQEDAEFLRTMEASLDAWSQPKQGLCNSLTPELLDQLTATGIVRSEAQLGQMLAQMQEAVLAQQQAAAEGNAGGPAVKPQLFTTFAVPPPPRLPRAPVPAASLAAEKEVQVDKPIGDATLNIYPQRNSKGALAFEMAKLPGTTLESLTAFLKNNVGAPAVDPTRVIREIRKCNFRTFCDFQPER